MNIHDYGKVYNHGVKYVLDVFNGPVVVQEKVDGSQFSFALDIDEGEVAYRSRKTQMTPYHYEAMFEHAIKAIDEIQHLLNPDYIYRGEYLGSPKHNALKYQRVPVRHVILFDIEEKAHPDVYLAPEVVQEEAKRLGLECVPTFYQGVVMKVEDILPFLENKPILGGDNVEGIVVKNYEIPDATGKFLKAKIVRTDFRELNGQEWKKANPTSKDITTELSTSLRTVARWRKGIQHLKEQGQLQNAPQDIGPLLKEISQDILDEEKEYIKETLFKHFWKDIIRGATRGFPEWYKRELMGMENNEID